MDIAISLGHNASAVLIEDGRVVLGYEEERFTKKKSDSSWPKNAIAEIFKHVPPSRREKNTLYISHWYDDFDFYKAEIDPRIQKHFVPEEVSALMNDYAFKIVTLDEDFTHHHAHAWSAVAFRLSNNKFRTLSEDVLVFVADGFGNNAEVLSIFKSRFNHGVESVELLSKVEGYNYSLGLMYQYATSFCGMKENEDEYKFLGYESQIDSVLMMEGIDKLEAIAIKIEDKLRTSSPVLQKKTGFIDISALEGTVKTEWHKTFQQAINEVNIHSRVELVGEDKNAVRVIIGYLIQTVIEDMMQEVVMKACEKYKIYDVCLAGGIFYNVKLNNAILNVVQGDLCVVPLAGDQAGGIGLFYAKNKEYLTNNFDGFSNLCIGKRDLSPETRRKDITDVVNGFHMSIIDKKLQFVNKVVEELEKNSLVNIVHSQMEFGPRALCNTSTLALPTKENVELINTLNKRNTVMPMAPVMLERFVDFFFEEKQYKKIIGSDKYMIITYDYRTSLLYSKYSGVMHKYPLIEKYSGRPQVIPHDALGIMNSILEKIWMKTGYACLINTSYNVHGVPIVRTLDDAIESYEFQQNIIKTLKDVPTTKNILVIGDF